MLISVKLQKRGVSLLLSLLYTCYFRSEYEKAMERRIAYTHEYEKNRKPASALMEQ